MMENHCLENAAYSSGELNRFSQYKVFYAAINYEWGWAFAMDNVLTMINFLTCGCHLK